MQSNKTSVKASKSNTILIIDDEETVRDSLKILLDYQGYQADIASDGRQGLDMLSKKEYFLLVLDIKMPDIDGFEILAKAQEAYPDMKIIIITGFGTLDVARQALALGADHYFDKPIDIQRFIQKVKKST